MSLGMRSTSISTSRRSRQQICEPMTDSWWQIHAPGHRCGPTPKAMWLWRPSLSIAAAQELAGVEIGPEDVEASRGR